MARVPRSLSVLPGFGVHKVWRGHNKEPNLGSDEHKTKYLEFLNKDLESEKYDVGCALQALCLMTNHTHEILGVKKVPEFSNHMRRHHSRYGMYFNRLNERCGKVAQDRAWTCLLADEDHEMRAVFYIHANPIRAGIVKDARDYHWSTHQLYAFGKRPDWMRNVILPSWYLRLGDNAEQRQRKYRQLFAAYLKEFGTKTQMFLRKLFYGPTLWIEQRQQVISKWRRSRSLALAPPS